MPERLVIKVGALILNTLEPLTTTSEAMSAKVNPPIVISPPEPIVILSDILATVDVSVYASSSPRDSSS